MMPFKCDLCHFRVLKGRDPVKGIVIDMKLQACIRQVNIDAFWSRETPTVSSNLSEARTGVRNARAVGLESAYPAMGPFPMKDTFGMQPAVLVLMRSLAPGIHAPTVQYDTMRKARSSYLNVYHASKGGMSLVVMVKDKNKTYVTTCSTYSYWFERFMLGAQKQMGRISKPNLGLSFEVMHALMNDLELDWTYGPVVDRPDLALLGSLLLILYLGAL